MRPITFALYDMRGRLIMNKSVAAENLSEFSLEGVSIGLYIMRYDNGYIGKLVKSE